MQNILEEFYGIKSIAKIKTGKHSWSHTLHVLRWVRAGHNTARCGLRTVPLPHGYRDRTRHALILSKSSLVAFWVQRTALFRPSFSLPAVSWLGYHRPPTELGNLVPFDHSGFHPLAMVVLVACTPLVGWSSWWVVARGTTGLVGCSWRAVAVSPVNQAFSPTLHYACHWSG